ncbi:UDP-N-acetylmuramoyl-tripeptide--D-alanyl-D-alanine ligase [Paenibacillaceae bacterium WGS1546]|uniref:UDP-N-acetylmuramoyl-tripeptide--D-alanyl-D- alanine ligase n=1 Tax=Cohnella sp. WGS1546 TaxID=3366810 RepID=UPI00372CFD77
MIMATVREIAAWSGATGVSGLTGGGPVVSGVSTDTRKIVPGQLFVPLRGDRFDGHDYIRAAEEAGAAAALWDESVPMPESGIPLVRVADTLAALQTLAKAYLREGLNVRTVAVTGSNGKTTTKDLVSAVLATTFVVHKTEGNYNNHIGLPLTILGAPRNTEVLVLEMGMSGFGEISLLSRLAEPDVAIVTNIGEAHLLQLGTRRNIAKAKLEIMDGLKPGGTLVYLGDEPLLAEELADARADRRARLLAFGEEAANDWVARYVRVTADGTQFTASGEAERVFELPIPGRHNAVNALAAVAVGRLFGLPFERIGEGLKLAKLTGMRIERVAAHNGAVVLNDAYNASPTSVKAAIRLVAELEGFRRKWVVLGDMLELGEKEKQLHGEIGRYLDETKADRVLAYGPLSRSIYEEAKRNYPDGGVRHFEDKAALVDCLLGELTAEDLVLVKASRGMRLEEVVVALQRGGMA